MVMMEWRVEGAMVEALSWWARGGSMPRELTLEHRFRLNAIPVLCDTCD